MWDIYENNGFHKTRFMRHNRFYNIPIYDLEWLVTRREIFFGSFRVRCALWLFSCEMRFSQEGGNGEESGGGRTRAKVAGLHTKVARRAKGDARVAGPGGCGLSISTCSLSGRGRARISQSRRSQPVRVHIRHRSFIYVTDQPEGYQVTILSNLSVFPLPYP